MIYIALREGETDYVGVTEVSEAIDSPKAFTSKILLQLSKANFLESLRGPSGGYRLAEGRTISLADIVRVIDGDKLLDGCILGFMECTSDHPCPVHFKFKSVRDYLKGALIATDVMEMRDVIERGEGFIK